MSITGTSTAAPLSVDPKLAADCAYRMVVREQGYSGREVIGVGRFYDLILGWREDDGSIFFSDLGGQAQPNFDPLVGHGGLFRLLPDDSVQPVVPHGSMNTYMPLIPRRAPAGFGPWEGHHFMAGQQYPGRAGASREHLVFRHAPGADHLEIFGVIPLHGHRGGGVPGAGMTGHFGRPGTKLENRFFVMSLMNSTVYTVDPEGHVKPFINLDKPTAPYPMAPLDIGYAPSWWGEHAGKLVVQALPDTTYEAEARAYLDYVYWPVTDDGRLAADEPIDAPTPIMNVALAPPEFGRFAGQAFWADEGPVNLMHVTRMDPGPLPYGARIFRYDPVTRKNYLFADYLQGGYNTLAFDRDRLIIGSVRKSYSTGEYHEPDSTVYEIRYRP